MTEASSLDIRAETDIDLLQYKIHPPENDRNEWQLIFTNTWGNSTVSVAACEHMRERTVCLFSHVDACVYVHPLMWVCVCMHMFVCVCLRASRQISLSSVISIVCLVVHDQSVLDEIEAVWAGLIRTLHHLTDWKTDNTCTSSIPTKAFLIPKQLEPIVHKQKKLKWLGQYYW